MVPYGVWYGGGCIGRDYYANFSRGNNFVVFVVLKKSTNFSATKKITIEPHPFKIMKVAIQIAPVSQVEKSGLPDSHGLLTTVLIVYCIGVQAARES